MTTSEAVLTRVLEARIFGATAATMDRARRKAQRYVQNPSFERALTILEERHVCIIAGIPGIGKTTLAEVLLTHYADRREFQAFRIARDLSEIDGVRRRDVPQVFYYDDFLGTTGFDTLGKNEDRRLVEFMQEVTEAPAWRFVLTTREYILAAAQTRHEALANAQFDHTTCVISLNDYSKTVRAEILYNHLYFSDLPQDMREALLPGRAYRKVYTHKYYNPRIIDVMTSTAQTQSTSPSEYAAAFLAALDDPRRIWQHAYENQLSQAARNLLLVRGSLPRNLLLDDLRTAFLALHESRRSRMGYSIADTDLHTALKALDGTFLRTYREHSKTLCDFHNPSVQDFVERRLSEEATDVRDIALGAAFMEQLKALWRGKGGPERLASVEDWLNAKKPPPGPVRYAGVAVYADAFVEGLRGVFDSPTCSVAQYSLSAGSETQWLRISESFEERVRFVLEVGDELGTPSSRDLAREKLNVLVARLAGGRCENRQALIEVMERLRGTGSSSREFADDTLAAGHKYLVSHLDELEDYAALASYIRACPGVVTPDELATARDGFEEVSRNSVRDALDASSGDDESWVYDTADKLEASARALDLDCDEEVRDLRGHAADIAGPDPDVDDYRLRRDERESGPAEALSEGEIDLMFESLRADSPDDGS